MSDEEDIFAASAATIVFLSLALVLQRQRRPRRFWVRPSLTARRRYSATDLMKDLILDDEDAFNLEYRSGAGFRNFFRISTSTFEEILNMIGPKISKCDTNLRKAIPAHERLAVTLRFLASGDSYHSLQYTFKISKQTISQAVPEVCEAIVKAMKNCIKVSTLLLFTLKICHKKQYNPYGIFNCNNILSNVVPVPVLSERDAP